MSPRRPEKLPTNGRATHPSLSVGLRPPGVSRPTGQLSVRPSEQRPLRLNEFVLDVPEATGAEVHVVRRRVGGTGRDDEGREGGEDRPSVGADDGAGRRLGSGVARRRRKVEEKEKEVLHGEVGEVSARFEEKSHGI